MQLLLRNKNYIYLIIITIIVGYFEIFSFQKTILHDAIDYYYPWRKTIVECIRNGNLPTWEFYQELGSPIMSNPQSGAWYPIIWIISLFSEYNLYVLNIEYGFHLILCGIGSYLLFYQFSKNKLASYTGAILYTFSGFIIGNFQHLSWLISASWMPFVFLSYIFLIQRNHFKYYLYIALFSYMLLSGGYAAFVILSVYLLIIYTIYQWFLHSEKRIKIIKKVFYTLIITLSISWLYVYSVLLNINNITRGSGLEMNRATKNPFEFSNWTSFLFSFSSTQKMSFFHSDIAMRNGYIGIFFIIILLYILFFQRTKKNVLLISLAIFILLIAVGKSFYLYPLIYKTVPGISLFKEISLFRYFAILILILIVVKNANQLIESKNRKKSLFIIGFILSILGSLYLIFYSNTEVFYQCILRQLKYQIFILILLSSIVLVLQNEKLKMGIFCFLIITEIIYSERLNFPYTVLRENELSKLQTIYSNIENNIPTTFKITKQTKPKDFTYKKMRYQPNLLTLGILTKEPSIVGETSFQLKQWAKFKKDTMELKKLINKPIAYVLNKQTTNLKIKQKGNELIIKANTYKKDRLIIHQNLIPGWNILVNSKISKINRFNRIFISVPLNKGLNIISLKYLPKGTVISFIGSLVLFLISSIYLLYFEFNQIKRNGH